MSFLFVAGVSEAQFPPPALSVPRPTTAIATTHATSRSPDHENFSPLDSSPSADSQNQIQTVPRSPSRPSSPSSCTTTDSGVIPFSSKPSPKVVINGIAPHVLDERKSRPQRIGYTGSTKSSNGSGGKRNLRRLQYIQKQLQRQQSEPQCQQSKLLQSYGAPTQYYPSSCPKFESSPLRVLGSCTFEDLQTQVEFVVDTKDTVKDSSCPVEIPIKNELTLTRCGAGGKKQGMRPRSRSWKVLKIHVDPRLFKSIVSKFKQAI